MQSEYSLVPTTKPVRDSVSATAREHMYEPDSEVTKLNKVQREYSIQPMAHAVRDSVGRWQVSIFVDC